MVPEELYQRVKKQAVILAKFPVRLLFLLVIYFEQCIQLCGCLRTWQVEICQIINHFCQRIQNLLI